MYIPWVLFILLCGKSFYRIKINKIFLVGHLTKNGNLSDWYIKYKNLIEVFDKK